MGLRGTAIAASILLMSASAGEAQSGPARRAAVDQEPSGRGAPEVIAGGRVEHVYGPHLFTIARDGGPPDRTLLVFAPTATVSPVPGSGLTARGTLRTCDDADLEVDGCDQLDARVRADYQSHSVLVARLLITATGRQLAGRVTRSQNAVAIPSLQDERRFDVHNDFPITVRPGTLASLVDSLAGGSVRLPYARVVGVFDRHVFLIETQTSLLPITQRNRVLVFIESGELRVDPATLVASTVTVSGIARTLLGMQANHDVPWPAALTRDAVKRLEVKAAVLARSVRTPEGIDLVVRSSSAAPAGGETSGTLRAAKER